MRRADRHFFLVIASLRFEEAESLGTFYKREVVLLVRGECLGRGGERQVECVCVSHMIYPSLGEAGEGHLLEYFQ